MQKNKKRLKNHNSKTIDPTEFCLAPSEREKLALSELLIASDPELCLSAQIV